MAKPNRNALVMNLCLTCNQCYIYQHMKVRVYFCRETDPQIILKGNKISKQALNTIYELVWECEFKNILNARMLENHYVHEGLC